MPFRNLPPASISALTLDPTMLVQRTKRGQRLKLAVAFSAISKVAGVVTQLLALTLGVRLLGNSGYAAYATIWAASLTPYLLALGFGPTLVSRIAKLDATGDRANLIQTAWSALIPSLVNLMAVGLGASALFLTWSPFQLFPNLSAIADQSVSSILIVLIWFHLTGVLFNTVESIQAGYQENYLLSVRATVGNVISALALVSWFVESPNLFVFVVCMHGPVLVTRFLNLCIFFTRHRELLSKPPTLSWKLTKELVAEGVIFSLVAGIAAYLCHQFPVLLLASAAGDAATTEFSATMNLVLQLFSVVAMIAVPFIPALSNSISLGDRKWAERAITRIALLIAGYGFLCVAFLAIAGPDFFSWWFRGELRPERNLLLAAGFYLLALGLENFLFLILCSMGRLKVAAGLYLFRALLTGLIAWVSSQYLQTSAIFLGGALATVFITIMPYWIITKQKISESFAPS